jgi:hypothetical protein
VLLCIPETPELNALLEIPRVTSTVPAAFVISI